MMMPLIFVLTGLVCFFVGLWPVALIFFVGAIVGVKNDKEVEETEERARAIGYGARMDVDNGIGILGDALILGFLLIVVVVLLGVV